MGGGTWERIKDRFLLAAGDTYTSGSTGGEATHQLTTNEMPSHTHGWNLQLGGYGGWPSKSMTGYVFKWSADTVYNQSGGTSTINVGNSNMNANNGYTGGSAAHNNMPPYLTVYVWKRTA